MTTVIPEGYRPPPDLLRERNILITGAGDGLGKATALACAAHGATVILVGKTVKKLENTYDAIRAAGGPEPAIVPMNFLTAVWKDYQMLAETLEKEFGALHGLMHSAAHFKRFTPLAEFDPKEWLETLQVNLTAAFALVRNTLPLLLKAPDASVVLVSDTAGRTGKPFHGAYGVSKFGLEGLMQTWASELERTQVRINTFDPGPMRTALRAKGYLHEGSGQARDPAEVATALLYLLDASRAPNGQAIGCAPAGHRA